MLVDSRKFFVVLTIFIGVLHFSYASSYQEPNIEVSLSQESISVSEEERVMSSTLLANFVKSQFSSLSKEEGTVIRQIVGIALLLDESNRTAVILNAKLKRNSSITEPDKKVNSTELSTSLLKLVDRCKAGKKDKDLMLAGCLLNLLAQLDSDNDLVLYEQELFFKKNSPANWAFLDGVCKQPGVSNEENSRLIIKSGVREGYEKKNRSSEKNQSTIKGLMTVTANDGGIVGTTMDIIITMTPPSKVNNFTYGFSRPAGEQMHASMTEAFRALRVRYPHFTPADMKVSFGDKYSPKDGGSAGTAFFLLMIGVLDGIEYDPDFAVTGDVTVDWKIREVGGVMEKVLGATRDKCKTVAIPMVNEKSLADLVILNSPSALWNIQIVGIETLEDAIEIARLDKSPTIISSSKRFTKVQSYLKKKKMYGVRNKALIKELKAIRRKQPNNLSVKYLLMLAEDKLPRKLSLETSINKIFLSAVKMMPYVLKVYRFTPPTEEESETMLKSLNKIEHIIDPKTNKFYKALVEFIKKKGEEQKARATMGKYGMSKSRSKKLSKAVLESNMSLKLVQSELLQSLVSDHKVIETLMAK